MSCQTPSSPISPSAIRTDCSPAIQSFPWVNGIVGVESKRDFLENALKEQDHTPEMVSIVLVSFAMVVNRLLLICCRILQAK